MKNKKKYFLALELACTDVIALKESAGEKLQCPWGPDATGCDSKDCGGCDPENPLPNQLLTCLEIFYIDAIAEMYKCPVCGQEKN